MATPRILKVIRQARTDHPLAQLELGRCYLHGIEGLGKNVSTAYLWLAKAADKGVENAAWLIGEHVPSHAVDNVPRAKAYFEKARAQGSISAGVTLAKWSLYGMLGPHSKEAIARQQGLLQNAAAAGNYQAEILIGMLAIGEGSENQDIKSLICAAERGEREAVERAFDYFWTKSGGDLWCAGQIPGQTGQGRNMDQISASRLALYWHEVLCPPYSRDISPSDMRRRGSLLLLNGLPDASKWIQTAAEEGDAIAAYLLALMYMGPEYINNLPADLSNSPSLSLNFPGRNFKQAANWLEKASNSLLIEADFALWSLNGLRNYTRRDSQEGKHRLTRAAENGHGEACWIKACEALREDDLITAAKWLDRAAATGNQKAATTIDRLATKVAEPNRKLLNASEGFRRQDIGLALRLELGAHFGLIEHEFLLLNPSRANAEDFLLIDVRADYSKAEPRLVRITSAAQRTVLHRAATSLSNYKITGEPYSNLKRRFHQKCERLGINIQA
jgi:TPR repeat protein